MENGAGIDAAAETAVPVFVPGINDGLPPVSFPKPGISAANQQPGCERSVWMEFHANMWRQKDVRVLANHVRADC